MRSLLMVIFLLLATSARGEERISANFPKKGEYPSTVYPWGINEAKPSRRAASKTEAHVVKEEVHIYFQKGEYSNVEILSKEAAVKLWYQLGEATEEKR